MIFQMTYLATCKLYVYVYSLRETSPLKDPAIRYDKIPPFLIPETFGETIPYHPCMAYSATC